MTNHTNAFPSPTQGYPRRAQMVGAAPTVATKGTSALKVHAMTINHKPVKTLCPTCHQWYAKHSDVHGVDDECPECLAITEQMLLRRLEERGIVLHKYAYNKPAHAEQ